ncbi:MAG TPA: molybdopterin-binding protein [Rhizomicrobium sp.]|nr:molybdopterin-binding protein [Rhizomicrobium sp.]
MADANRRNFLTRLAVGTGAAVLAGCDKISQSASGSDFLKKGSDLAYKVQRLFAGREALAPEFSKADIAPVFRPNGTLYPMGEAYKAHAADNFRDWRVKVGGLVEHPFELSLPDLRALPSRTQITRHDCVEGWSCIGEWTGTPLRLVLAKAKPKDNARFVLFHCADDMSRDGLQPQLYYESLDLVEALHPQTILAYDLNGQPLPIANGAPVRLRAERQLGYKMAKYVTGIELVESFADIRGGNGGYWEDQGYTWWAGI